MSNLLADSLYCCSRCLRAQFGSSTGRRAAATATTAAQHRQKSSRSRSNRSNFVETTAASRSSRSSISCSGDSNHAHWQEGRRRRQLSTTSKRAVPPPSNAAYSSGSSVDGAATSPAAMTVSPAANGDLPLHDRLQRQLQDLEDLLLRITGNDQPRSTRLVAFPDHQGGHVEELAWIDRVGQGITRLDKQRQQQRKTRVAGESMFPALILPCIADNQLMSIDQLVGSPGRLCSRSGTIFAGTARRPLGKRYLCCPHLTGSPT